MAITRLQSPIGEASGTEALSQTELSSKGILHNRASTDWIEIDDCSATTGWAVIGNDTVNLTTDLSHVLGTKSLEFDKTDGAANTIFAGVTKTVTSIDASRFGVHGLVCAALSCSANTNVAYAFVRLGTDASNYAEFRLADSSITGAAWSLFEVEFIAQQLTVVGTGLDLSAITWVSVGVAFDAETDALADILWDHIAVAAAVKTT